MTSQGTVGASGADDVLRPPSTTIKVRFHELDPYGHVNHAVYLSYFEQARVDLLDHIGYGLPRLVELGYHIVVIEAHVRFRSPAVAGDVLEVVTTIAERRRASSWWHQRLLRGPELVATNDVRAAITDTDGRPTAPPQGFVAALDRLEGLDAL
jgi:acyl-CoA thioester hydrolase